MSGPRRVRIPVSYILFEQWLTGSYRVPDESNVPDDLRVVGFSDDPYRGVAYVYCESSAFDPVPEASDPPEWTPVFKVRTAA